MTTRIALCAALVFLLPDPGRAGEERIRVELNRLEPQASACQAYLVLENGTGSVFSSLSLDLVMFDAEGIIARRLAVEMAPLRPGRTSVKVFAIEGLACEGLTRILVNDVLSCEADPVPAGDCLALVETASRTPVDLID